MKTSVTANKFLDNNRLADDIFHELKSIISSILSSVELIALYDGKAVPGKITRQAEAIKSQVIELDFQLQNVRIIQLILSQSFVLKRKMTNVHFFLTQFIREEPYTKLLSPAVELQQNKGTADAFIDEFVIRQLILNLFFWMNRHSSTYQLPRLIFSFEEGYFEIRGHFFANYIFSSPFKSSAHEHRVTDSELLNQPICYLMSYLAALHDGNFEITAAQEKNVVVVVRIPYKPNGVR
ncbi:hypothetical protein SAMN05518672_104184 [Chitinophaga sp. CF118]|uniref:hypothetical protein n=1 Tax=Chitinophaga sp. CF118 TaxID=1884367 RepID=UPI0008E65524|nr:hypothetical protein [Chitinophaga sp. CF118]SFE02638.1 hypothetical protein SAMN05518672_104184 [Chitinophaga sp. CF118]